MTNTFRNGVEKRNPYQFKNRHRRPEPTPSSFSSPMYYTSYPSRTMKEMC